MSYFRWYRRFVGGKWYKVWACKAYMGGFEYWVREGHKFQSNEQIIDTEDWG